MSSQPRIELLADADRAGGFMLIMDSVMQSYVDLADPTYLDFEYVQFFASVVEILPDGPVAATHVGGGGLTLARYLNAIRPGSSHIVLEPDVSLTELVRRDLPLPRNHRIRIRPQDGVTGVAALAEASADLLILDAFADGRVPASLTSVEFFTDCSRVLKSAGVLLVNLVDEPGLRYVGRAVSGLRSIFGDVVLICATDVLKGRRFGNVVVAATSATFDIPNLRRLIARQPFPATLLATPELSRRFAGLRPWTSEDGAESPEPARDGWRVR